VGAGREGSVGAGSVSPCPRLHKGARAGHLEQAHVRVVLQQRGQPVRPEELPRLFRV
jgi:hypothetical protein